jgi:hypothetical protein
MSDGRICTKCLVWKERKDFRKTQLNIKYPDAIFPQCLECERAYNNKRYKKVEKKEKIKDLTGRICTRCKTYKLAEFFRLAPNKKSLCSYCRECENMKNRIHQAKLKGKTVNEMGYIRKQKTDAYVVNKDLHCELVVSLAQGYLTRKAEKMLKLICEGVIRKFSYSDSMDREDCLSEAYYVVFKNWMGYDPFEETAFQYITEVAKRAISRGYNKLYKKGSDGEYIKQIAFSRLFAEGGEINL